MYRSTEELPGASGDPALRPTDVVDVKGATKVLGLSVSMLNKMRAFRTGESPRFMRCGRAIRYRICDLHAWQEERLAGGRQPRPASSLSTRPNHPQDQE